MSWVATAIGGSAIVGAVVGSNASSDAADAQASAAKKASAIDKYKFDKTLEINEPWLEAGQTALTKLMGGYTMAKPDRSAIEAELLKEQGVDTESDSGATYNIGFFGTLLNMIKNRVQEKRREDAAADISEEVDAAYAAAMKEYEGSKVEGLLTSGPGEYTESDYHKWLTAKGEQDTENYLASRGLTNDSIAGRAITDYKQNAAMGGRQQWLDEYYQSLNPWFSAAGLGQVATNTVSNANTASAANQINSAYEAGNARASGYINNANSITGNLQTGINNYLMWKALA